MAQFIRDQDDEEARTVPAIRRLHDRYIHLQAPPGLGQHPPRRPRGQALSPPRPELRRPAPGGRLRPDAGHRPLRRQPRHPAGHLRHLVDPADAADRGRPPEPPGQPVAAPPAGTRPAPTGVGGPGPRRQAPAQPAGTGLPHRQQPRAPHPPADRHPHAGLAQRRPRRRQRLQAHRGDAGQREHHAAAEHRTAGALSSS